MTRLKLRSQLGIDMSTTRLLTPGDVSVIALDAYDTYCTGSCNVVSTQNIWPFYDPFLIVDVPHTNEGIDKNYVLIAYNSRMDRDHVFLCGWCTHQDLLPYYKNTSVRGKRYVVPEDKLRDPSSLLK